MSASVAILLGAGASVDAGLPTSVGMTDEVIARISHPAQVQILQFVRHTLAASIAREDLSHTALTAAVAVDVERFLAAVELLAERENQPWSPFVATWHPGLERYAQPSSAFSDRHRLERALGSIGPRGTREAAGAIADYVERAVARARGGDVGALLSQARTAMLRSLFDVLKIEDPVRVGYLAPLIDLARAQGSLTIATLNYDRSVENAAEAAGEQCDTGIETWLASGALDWPRKGLRLLKLHGSIDWVFEERSERDELPLLHLRKVTPAEKPDYEAPAVIFGEAGKLRAEGPYLELLLAWSAQLNEASSLIVVGYSFRDTHVNEMIARWFNAGRRRRIVVLDPADPGGDWQSFGARLRRFAEPHPQTDEPQVPRVVHIAKTAALGLSEAIAEAAVRTQARQQPF